MEYPFTTWTDIYRGVHIQFENKIAFESLLHQLDSIYSLPQQPTSIWLHTSTLNASFLEALTNQFQFKIHHAENKSIVLYKWLSKSKDPVVPYSKFFIAAGAIVIHENKILLVQQKGGKRKGFFGLPGGRADPGETIDACSERELFEQTNLKAKFEYILYFRDRRGQIYDSVDVYFACVMRLDEKSLEQLKMCPVEIQSYSWVELNQLSSFIVGKSFGTQLRVLNYISDLHLKGVDLKEIHLEQTSQYNHLEKEQTVVMKQHRLVVIPK